ncbi:MAG: hypothetical protein WBQ50_07860 [Nocardioides sp.]
MNVVIVLLLLLLVAACALAWWHPPLRRVGPAAVLALVAGLPLLGLVSLLGGPLDFADEPLGRSLLVALGVVAVAGGGPVTALVLRLADGAGSSTTGVADAAAVLRGGTWIGAFERAGIFAALAAGWPEGIAVVLGLKGLGRYSELKASSVSTPADPEAPGSPGNPGVSTGGVAERFIIGTFSSVLWAAACAGLLAVLTLG